MDSIKDNCGFEGNPDLYGLGIRLGLYFQLISIYLAVFILDKTKYPRYFAVTSGAMSLATFAVLIMESARNSLHGVEIYIVLSVILLQLVGASWVSWSRGVVVGYLTSILVWLSLGSYLMWFVYRGPKAFPLGCIKPLNFIAKILSSRGFQIAQRVIFTMAFAFSFIMALVLLMCLPLYSISVKDIRARPGYILDDEDRSDTDSQNTPENAKEESRFRLVGAALAFCLACPSFVLPAELMIRFAKIEGVGRLDTVGQLVPFLLGLGPLLNIIYRVFRRTVLGDTAEDAQTSAKESEECSHNMRQNRNGFKLVPRDECNLSSEEFSHIVRHNRISKPSQNGVKMVPRHELYLGPSRF